MLVESSLSTVRPRSALPRDLVDAVIAVIRPTRLNNSDGRNSPTP